MNQLFPLRRPFGTQVLYTGRQIVIAETGKFSTRQLVRCPVQGFYRISVHHSLLVCIRCHSGDSRFLRRRSPLLNTWKLTDPAHSSRLPGFPFHPLIESCRSDSLPFQALFTSMCLVDCPIVGLGSVIRSIFLELKVGCQSMAVYQDEDTITVATISV